MKKIIFKDCFGYKVTDEQNYNSPIRNANKVIDCKDFDDAESIIDYFCKYVNAKKEDFIIIE